MFLFAITIAVALALGTGQPVINASHSLKIIISEELSLQNTWFNDSGVDEKFEATNR